MFLYELERTIFLIEERENNLSSKIGQQPKVIIRGFRGKALSTITNKRDRALSTITNKKIEIQRDKALSTITNKRET